MKNVFHFYMYFFYSSFELLFDPRLNGHRGVGRCGCRNSITGAAFIFTLSVGRHLLLVIIDAFGLGLVLNIALCSKADGFDKKIDCPELG